MVRIQKRALTLLEIMIVICIIGIIAGVIGFNMKGSLEEGKAKKTEIAIQKIKDILELEVATSNKTAEEVANNAEKYLKLSGLVKDVNNFIKDGWGVEYEINSNSQGISVVSRKLNSYNAKRNRVLNEATISSDEEDYS